MNITDLLIQFQTVKTDIAGGMFLKAVEDTQPIQNSLIALGRNLGFKAAADDEAKCKEIATCFNECKALIKSPPKGADPVNKLGDGHILAALDNLFTLFSKWLPLILPLITPFLGPDGKPVAP